jgi:hypothetical protein
VVFCHDRESGLNAIIGLHDISRGPALGGTRCFPYANEAYALIHSLWLAQGMTASVLVRRGDSEALASGSNRSRLGTALTVHFGTRGYPSCTLETGVAMNAEQPDIAAAIGTDPSVDATQDASDNESYHGYSVDDETQPQSTGDSLVDDDRGLVDPLDEGYSPPERWSAGQGFGNTPLEESMGESLDQRLEQEVPEPDPYELAASEAERGDLDRYVRQDEPADGTEASEAGAERAGRLVESDEGVRTDTEPDLVAWDAGIDGAAAGAEEAAVHVIHDPDLEPPD